MQITLTIDDEKWGWLEAKPGVPKDNLMLKVNEYLDACGRDVGADVAAELQAEIAKLDTAGKASLLELVRGQ